MLTHSPLRLLLLSTASRPLGVYQVACYYYFIWQPCTEEMLRQGLEVLESTICCPTIDVQVRQLHEDAGPTRTFHMIGACSHQHHHPSK